MRSLSKIRENILVIIKIAFLDRLEDINHSALNTWVGIPGKKMKEAQKDIDIFLMYMFSCFYSLWWNTQDFGAYAPFIFVEAIVAEIYCFCGVSTGVIGTWVGWIGFQELWHCWWEFLISILSFSLWNFKDI